MQGYKKNSYNGLNVDDRPLVTNLATLEQYEADVKETIEANRPKPVKVVVFNADDLSQTTYDSTVNEENGLILVATSDKKMEKKSAASSFTHNGISYTTEYGLSVGGKASFGSNRYVSFTVEGPCTITIAVRSSGSDARTLLLVDAAGNNIGSYEAGTSLTVSSVDVTEAGTYSVGSAGNGMYIYVIIIEYFE